MIYRQWALRRKVAYWLVLAGLATAACLLLVNDGFGTSSASPSAASTADRDPMPPPVDAGTAQGASLGMTTTTGAPPTATVSSIASSPALAVPKRTLVAALKGDVAGSPGPGSAPTQTVPGSWYGFPSVLPVVSKAPGWLEVRLAQRPNESTAWIPASDATVSVDHFAVVGPRDDAPRRVRAREAGR